MCNHLHADLHHISLPQTCLNTLYEDTDLRVWQQNNDDFLRSIIRTINRYVPILSLLLSLSSWVNYPALENTDTLQRVRFLSRDHRLTITLLLDSEKRKKKKRRKKWKTIKMIQLDRDRCVSNGKEISMEIVATSILHHTMAKNTIL